MYISKIRLKEAAVFKEIFASGYALHQKVWDLFADSPDRKRDFLYRLDSIGKMPLVYAMSVRKPVDNKDIWNIEIKDYAPQIKERMKFGFTVRVNPVCKRDGKRHDVVMDAKYKMRKVTSGQDNKKTAQEIITDACRKWIEKRSEKNGFKITKQNEELVLRADGYQQTQFYKSTGSESIQYSTVDITGALEVTNERNFKKMLFFGLGPAKGFGCGLMLIRKI